MKYCLLTLLIFAQFSGFAIDKKWRSLFDGKTLNGWSVKAGSAFYEVKNGSIAGTTVPGSPNTFLATEKTYKNFILEFEFHIEDTSVNSGLQFRSHFDPAGNNGRGKVFGYQYELDPSMRSWSGGIYDEGRRDWLYPVSNNDLARRAYSYRSFNKARIECYENYTRTYLNDILISQLVDTLSEEGFIALQVHSIQKPGQEGKKIYWRNIRIKEIDELPMNDASKAPVINLIPNNISEWEKASEVKLLFDGKTTQGWVGAYKSSFPEKGWKINDGILSVEASEGKESTNGGDIVTTDQYAAFDLSFEFKLAPGANSGVKYFVTLSEKNTGSAIGLEYQLLDDTVHPDAKLGREGNRTLSSLYDLITAKKQERFYKLPGSWNRGRIVVYPNNKVEHYLNGVKVLDYVRGSEEFRKLVSESKYKVWENFGEAPKGYILLQDHGDKVEFRSIRIKEL
jgi:hypothetical protein